MSILAGRPTRVVFQGLADPGAETAARRMIAAGTGLLAAVAEGMGGEEFEGIAVFETVSEAVREKGVTASVVYAEASAAADAVLEAADAGLDLVVCTTPGVPLLDAAEMKRELAGGRTRLVGPGSSGVVTPGECMLGELKPEAFAPGRIGQVGSGPGLMLEAAWQLRAAGLGTSTAIDLGGEPVRGLAPAEALSLFRADSDTDAILLTGAIDVHDVDDCARVIAATGKLIAAYMPVTASGEAAGVCRSRIASAGAALIDDPAAMARTVAEILA